MSFVGRITKMPDDTYKITIPIEVVRYMSLEEGMFIKVQLSDPVKVVVSKSTTINVHPSEVRWIRKGEVIHPKLREESKNGKS